MVRTDIKTRYGAHAQALQWGWLSPNEVRALEDMNPRDDGDIYYPPPNTAGKDGGTSEKDEKDDDAYRAPPICGSAPWRVAHDRRPAAAGVHTSIGPQQLRGPRRRRAAPPG